MEQCPPGYRLYADIVRRFGPVRASGDGLTCRCPFPGRHRNGDRNWSCRLWIGGRGELVARCLGCGADFPEFTAWAGVPARQWFPDRYRAGPMPDDPKPVLVATYDYRDRGGVLLFQKLRYEPKGFRLRRPVPRRFRKAGDPTSVPPDAEAWVGGGGVLGGGQFGRAAVEGRWDFWPFDETKHQQMIELPPVDPPLYRLPELAAADPARPVWVVEGENDVELLRRLGQVAVCGHAGSSVWLGSWSAELAGRKVVIVPDLNEVGHQHACKAAGSLIQFRAAGVKVLGWDHHDPGEGGGLGNLLAKLPPGRHKQTLADLCRLYPSWTPGPTAARPQPTRAPESSYPEYPVEAA